MSADAPRLTPELIARSESDEELYDLLAAELSLRLGGGPGSATDLDGFVLQLRRLPRGLRAMAATHELDVSITLDDLGDHLINWHHLGLAEETLLGLRELGAEEAAGLFEKALAIARANWDLFGSPGFHDRYHGSEIEAALDPLIQPFWERLPGGERRIDILGLWAPYARRHPENVCGH